MKEILKAHPGLGALALAIIIGGIAFTKVQHSGAGSALVIAATVLVLVIVLRQEIRAYRRSHVDNNRQPRR